MHSKHCRKLAHPADRASRPLTIHTDFPSAYLDVYRPATDSEARVEMTPTNSDDFLIFLTKVIKRFAPDSNVFRFRVIAVFDSVPETAANWMEGEFGIDDDTGLTESNCRALAALLEWLVCKFADDFDSAAIKHGKNPNSYDFSVLSLAADGDCIHALINVATLHGDKEQ